MTPLFECPFSGNLDSEKILQGHTRDFLLSPPKSLRAKKVPTCNRLHMQRCLLATCFTCGLLLSAKFLSGYASPPITLNFKRQDKELSLQNFDELMPCKILPDEDSFSKPALQKPSKYVGD
jgi:hypothetical protein